MSVVLVKSEANINGRRPAMVPEGADAVRCVKRRRREPALPPATTDGNGAPVDHSATTGTVKRSSRFRGVSRHRWTGRFEAHLWDKGSWNVTQRKKGKQVYLGAYDEEESAARAYDLAALKYWGPTTFTNFPVSDYEKEIQIMQNVTKEEYLASLRRKSSGFSRGVSKYRGVARHHHNGRWEARIGRVFGNKYLYLGTYTTQEEAAHAYDIAAIEYRGINAVTNFDLSTYIRWLRPGATNALASSTAEHNANGETQSAQPNAINFLSSGAEPPPRRNPFVSDEIDSPRKMEFTSQRIPGSGLYSKSSPTALGLLLRSSMFRQLVEKNSSIPGEETCGEESMAQRQQMMASDDYHRAFYAGVEGSPYACSPSVDTRSRIVLQESGSYYDCGEQPPWNGVLSLPPMQEMERGRL